MEFLLRKFLLQEVKISLQSKVSSWMPRIYDKTLKRVIERLVT